MDFTIDLSPIPDFRIGDVYLIEIEGVRYPRRVKAINRLADGSTELILESMPATSD